MAKVGDKYILHSITGVDYHIEIINVNEYREPTMRYGCDVYDDNGVYVGDVRFCGEGLLKNCEKVN